MLVVAGIAAFGVFLWAKYALPLGARALPAFLIVGWIYLVTRPISGVWRKLGPSPSIVVGTFAVQAFTAAWLVVALAIAIHSITTGIAPISATRESVGILFFWLTAPFWWALACALAMLFRRAA
nr:hypothetical protein [uncultured bacterium]